MQLQIKNISKKFGKIRALSGVSLDVKPGCIHALCGENGAGKSTLMNIISGNLQPDDGEIYINNNQVHFKNAGDAYAHKFAIVHQHLSLSANLSVADNIFANRQPKNKFGFINYQLLHQQTEQLLNELQMTALQPQSLIKYLSPPQKQMVEIAKAISTTPELLILDEPTTSLTNVETTILFKCIRKLAASGTSIIYISHRLQEVFALANTISVLKDGVLQATIPAADINYDRLIQLMIGRNLPQVEVMPERISQLLLRVNDLSGGKVNNVSFDLHKGEILGVAGLAGAGRTELARLLFGVDKKVNGSITINGKQVIINSPLQAINAGLGYLPEDRKSDGLFLKMTVSENIVAAKLTAAVKRGWFFETEASVIANSFKQQLRIITTDSKTVVHTLSGGNQQKVVVAKWLLRNPDILIVDEPTVGIDVGAKFEIYALLQQLTTKGKGIIFISSDLPELLAVSHRILVIKNGSISGIVDKSDFSEQRIIQLAY